VNGGCCKVCKSVAHRAKDCPVEAAQKAEERKAGKADKEEVFGALARGQPVLGTGEAAGADEDDFMAATREFQGNRKRHAPAKNGQRGPAKAPGAEGAFVQEKEKAKPVVKKKKVVAF